MSCEVEIKSMETLLHKNSHAVSFQYILLPICQTNCSWMEYFAFYDDDL